MEHQPDIHHSHLGKWLLAALAVLLIGASVYFFIRYRDAKTELAQLKDPTVQEALLKAENEALITSIGMLIELPQGEEPVIGTISTIFEKTYQCWTSIFE